MKPLTKTAMLALLSALLCTSTHAQDQNRPNDRAGRRGPPREGPSEAQGPKHAPDPAQAAAHVAKAYADLAPFDVNKDGQLDESEVEAILAAVEDGSLKVPPHRTPPADRAEQGRGPEGRAPSPDRMVHHMTTVYGQVQAFDANKDETMDETELAALQSAIADGKLSIGGRHGSPRGGQHEARPEGGPEGRPDAAPGARDGRRAGPRPEGRPEGGPEGRRGSRPEGRPMPPTE